LALFTRLYRDARSTKHKICSITVTNNEHGISGPLVVSIKILVLQDVNTQVQSKHNCYGMKCHDIW